MSFDRTAPNRNVRFTPRIDKSLIVELDEIMATCSLPEVVTWDTRTEEEYDAIYRKVLESSVDVGQETPSKRHRSSA